jgi:diamine N-acetyltransferase
MVNFKLVEDVKEIEKVASLAREIWTEHYTPIIGQEQVEYMLENFQSAGAIKEQIQTGVLYYLISNMESQAGYLALEPYLEDKQAKLSKIYVRSDLRGMGLGRKALEQAINVCRQLSVEILWLTVNKNNKLAIDFYERTGFIKAGTLVQDIGAGFVMDDYKMVKKIIP